MPETISAEAARYFHLFWDCAPFPVMLIRRDRVIVDRNRAAEAAGCIPGTRCSERGPREAHLGCLADRALDEGTAKRKVEFRADKGAVVDTYWIPLAGAEGLFLHFGIDITPYADGRRFPLKGA